MEPCDAVKIARLEEQVAGLREAVKLQAAEYERRLAELNHAAVRLAADKMQFVNVDVFNVKMDQVMHWRGGIDRWRAKMTGIAVGAGSIAGIAGGILTGLILKALN